MGMDIYAYSQIENLQKIAEANGIVVPRVRGYRLMANESELTCNTIYHAIRDHEMSIYERACESCPRFRPDSNIVEFSSATDRLRKKYLVKENGEIVGFRWDLVHGKNRKVIKYAVKKGRRAVIKQLETFNKYVGRNDILYIHARIGGPNWGYFGGDDIAREPWFVEKVDDYFDDTYCDIYARIAVGEYRELNGEVEDGNRETT